MKPLWFKRKWYGWGWRPASLEGWVVTLLYIGGVAARAFTLDESMGFGEMVRTFFVPVAILTALFIVVAYKTGESPRWQWGPPKE